MTLRSRISLDTRRGTSASAVTSPRHPLKETSFVSVTNFTYMGLILHAWHALKRPVEAHNIFRSSCSVVSTGGRRATSSSEPADPVTCQILRLIEGVKIKAPCVWYLVSFRVDLITMDRVATQSFTNSISLKECYGTEVSVACKTFLLP